MGEKVVGGFKKSVEHDYQYSRSIDNPIDPIHATVTYGSSSPNHQEFIATVTGGSGDYTYRWYKGIGASSSNFESTWSGSAPTFIWNNISGCDIHWVKLVVTDNQYGGLDESVRIIKNNNECDDDGNNGGNQN